MAAPNYELTERITDQSIDYLFISKGKGYTFFGGIEDDNGAIRLEPYIPNKRYGSVFVMKK